MRRLVLLAILLPAVGSAQSLYPRGLSAEFVPSYFDFLQPTAGNPPGSVPAVSQTFAGGGCQSGAPITTTRATTETVVVANPNQTSPGLIPEDAGTVSHVVFNGNLLKWSNDFTQGSAWIGNGGVATSAGQITASAGAGLHAVSGQAFAPAVAAGPHTFQIKFKPGTATWVWASVDSGGSVVWFNLIGSGTVGTVQAGNTATVALQSDGYYLITVTKTLSAGVTYPYFGLSPADATTSWTAVGTETIFAKEAQVNVGSALPYYATGAIPGFTDTKGNAWTQNGTVPQVPAPWFAPPASGPYSAANNYQGPTTLGEWTGDWSATVVFTPTQAVLLQDLLVKTNASGTQGWIARPTNGGALTCLVYDGAWRTAQTAGIVIPGVPNVLTCGRSSGTLYAKLNGAAAATAAVGAMVAASSEPVRIGREAGAGNEAATTTIHEVYLSTTPYNDAAVGALQSSILAKIGQPTLKSCAVNEAPVGTAGIEVYAAGTNAVTAPSASCVANAVSAPWSLGGTTPTCVTDVAVGPDGTTTMDEWTSTVNTQLLGQSVTTASSATFTASAWMAKPSGVGTSTILLQCPSGTMNTCACGTSDGSACSAAASAVNCTVKATSVSTTPVRAWASGTCSAAVTTPLIYLMPGDYQVSTGTTRFWGAQVETGLYPTPFTTGTRNATVSTVPLPALHTSNKFCVGVTPTPSSGKTWAMGTPGVWQTGTAFTANTIALYVNAGAATLFSVDNASASKYATAILSGSAAKRIVGCSNGGALSIYADGTLVSGAPTGAGTGLLNSTPATLQLGYVTGYSYFDGSLRDLRIYPNSTYRSGM